jgi:4-hydroxybenzoate polyprenyltransferase
MRPFAHRPVRRRRHRELFALSVLLFVLGAFVLDGLGGLALFAAIFVFFLAIMHRLSGEDTAQAERIGFIVGGG